MTVSKLDGTVAETRPMFFPKAAAAPAGRYLASPSRTCLLACLDDDPASSAVLPHAQAIGEALGLPVTLGRVIDTPRLNSPADPIEWKLQRDLHATRLAEMGRDNPSDRKMSSVVLSGAPADSLVGWARDNGGTLLALARRGLEGQGLGTTAQRLLEHSPVSLLLVPPEGNSRIVRYRRILVPIDGSARSESVLPVATRIARAHEAKLVLVHVIPNLEIADEGRTGRLRELHDQIDAHNERKARRNLETLRARCVGDGVVVQLMIAGPGDPRVVLRTLADEQQADLLVLSAHGRTGLADTSCGSVAEYLAVHSDLPILLVRPSLMCRFGGPSDSIKRHAAGQVSG